MVAAFRFCLRMPPDAAICGRAVSRYARRYGHGMPILLARAATPRRDGRARYCYCYFDTCHTYGERQAGICALDMR